MNWLEGELGDFLTLKRGHDLPKGKRKAGEVPVVSSSGFTGWHDEPKAAPPGVVTGRYGTIGEVFYVDQPYWPLNTALYVIDFKGNDPRFVSYFLRQQLKNYQSDKAAVPGVDRNVLHKLPAKCPKPETQQAIVRILSAYDDLIENNRRRIALLEEAARQLYKEWFVRFRFPGHEHVKIIDGVPEGWEEGSISDFYGTSSGGTPSRKVPEYFDGSIQWVKTGELQGGFIHQTEESITEEAIRNSSAKLFPRHTVLVAMYGATIAQIGILASPAASNQACCALTPTHPAATSTFAYLFLEQNREKLIGRGKGAAQNNISQSVIKGFPMTLPSQAISDAFYEVMEPLFGQIENRQEQNLFLASSRDLILPRLMNGSLAV